MPPNGGGAEMAAGGGEQKASVGTPTVFISYASQDADAANSIVENLEQHRLVTTWFSCPSTIRRRHSSRGSEVRVVNPKSPASAHLRGKLKGLT